MRLVLAAGVFDLLHVAHIRHLRAAAAMGTRLVVSVTRDSCVGKLGRPIIDEDERAEMLRALEFVDQVVICDSAYAALVEVSPHVFVKGHDYRDKGLLPEEQSFCEERGIVVRYTPPHPQTTTGIIERIRA